MLTQQYTMLLQDAKKASTPAVSGQQHSPLHFKKVVQCKSDTVP
jgi:hypothetical protein